MLILTPAYDICPQNRTGNEASQAMLISADDNMSRISSCLEAANNFLLSREEAIAIVEAQIQSMTKNWSSVCDSAELNEADRSLLWRRQFLNPYAFEDLNDLSKKTCQVLYLEFMMF